MYVCLFMYILYICMHAYTMYVCVYVCTRYQVTLRATELLDMFGAVQSVRSTTQDRGGYLDVVITRVDDTPSVVDVIRIPGKASDHRLVTWPFVAAPAETPVYKTQHRRSWRQFDLERFRSDLAASCLCDGTL